jgi:hypothetical protein
MVSRQYPLSRAGIISSGIIIFVVVLMPLLCGCLQVEPEELPPITIPNTVTTTGSEVVQSISDTTPRIPPPITITSPRLTSLVSSQDFPPEIQTAINDFTDGRTSGAINGFLRWESVRARTNKEDTARIQEQIHRIDYAFYNTSLKENISVYVGLTAEQARKVRNESVFSDSGYIIASYDPSVVYHQLAGTSRDSEGYLTICMIDFQRGNHLLYINATEREFLLPRDGIWDVDGEDTYRELTVAADSIPRYDDMVQTDVRIIRTKEHP